MQPTCVAVKFYPNNCDDHFVWPTACITSKVRLGSLHGVGMKIGVTVDLIFILGNC